MHDYESAAWAEHHGKLSSFIRDVLAAFQQLQHIRFDAPWHTPSR